MSKFYSLNVDSFSIEAAYYEVGSSSSGISMGIDLQLRCDDSLHENEPLPDNPTLAEIMKTAEKHWRMHETNEG